jgi:hypothetical protein
MSKLLRFLWICKEINRKRSKTADFSDGTLDYLIPQTAQTGDTLLNVNGTAKVDDTTHISIAYPTGRSDIELGDTLTLIKATTLNTDGLTELTIETAGSDTFTLTVDGNDLKAVLGQLSPTGPVYERLKAFAESRATGLAHNQGLDYLLNKGFGTALAITSGPGYRSAAFGTLEEGMTAGSHVDVSGVSARSLKADAGIMIRIPSTFNAGGITVIGYVPLQGREKNHLVYSDRHAYR